MALSSRAQRRIVLLFAAASLACAPVPREGESVHIADESAIILWDAQARTQHFIRRATFETKAKDFGFLVPTPSVPELAEANDKAFTLLEEITRPAYQGPLAVATAAKARTPRSERAVEVLKQARVAGYDAAVLKANDAGALDTWLKNNGYASSPELMKWYTPYVTDKWIITAFKLAGDGSGSAAAGAVRMTFKADQPFFPYREPASASGGRHKFTVFYLGSERVEGRIGAEGAWAGRTHWSGILEARDSERLWDLLKLPSQAPAGIRLTKFVDYSQARHSDGDLFFVTAKDQSEVLNDMNKVYDEADAAERRNVWIGIGLAVLLIVGIVLDLWRRRIRKK